MVQNVYGVTLSNIEYDFAANRAGDGEGGLNNQNEVNMITLTFSSDSVADDEHYVPTVALTGTSNAATVPGSTSTSGDPVTYAATANVAYCDLSAPSTGITAISVTIANAPIVSSAGV